jgi:TolB-like protein/tetratricopeptide (TPR) repeat protein
MIAVLPFQNLSGGSEHEYVADGLTEETISQLGRFSPETLGVIARTTVMQYKGVSRAVREIGDELKVSFILEGSVRREADRVRVTAQLIDVHEQTHLWSGTYEETTRSILAFQGELAADIGRQIQRRVAPPQTGLSDGRIVHPDAYHAHLQGRHLLNGFTPESVRRSVECFRRATAADPEYAPSYASLAEAYERLPIWVNEPAANTLSLALEAAEHALRLDPDLPEAHASLGLINANYLWDWAKAEAHFQRALELNPSCSPARLWFAEFLAEMGRIDEALETIERARIYDPLSRSIQATRAFVFWLGRRFDDAIAQSEQVLQMAPDYPMALIRLGVACAGKGLYDDAARAFRRAKTAAPALLDCRSLLAYAEALGGNRPAALEQLGELQQLAERRYVPPFVFAMVYLGLGEHTLSLEAMEEEYDARGWYLLMLNRGPQFDVLRPHPRFQALLRRMNFPD